MQNTSPVHDISEEGRVNMEVDQSATSAYNQGGGSSTELLGTVSPEEVYAALIDGSKYKCGKDAL